MCQIKELFLVALQNQKHKKKYTRTVFFLMFLSMVMCIGVNSVIKSIDKSIQNVIDKPLGKLIQIIDNSDDDSFISQVREELGTLDITKDIIRLVPFIGATWNQTEDILYSKSASINLLSYFSGLDEYGMSGKYSEIEQGEILIPEYLYGMGDYGLYEYVSGSLLIGTEMEISVHNYNNSKDYKYTFQIVGTYDNINSACVNNMFFVNDVQADEIYSQTWEDIEIEIEKNKELYKEEWEKNPELFDDYYTKHYIGVYVKSGSDVEEMQKLIKESTGMLGSPMQIPDESLLRYFQMILKICKVVVAMLLIVAFVSLLITIMTDLKQRNGEIAVDFAIGYPYKNIILMLAFEKTILVFQSGLTAFLFTGAGILGGNYFIQKCLPFYWRTIVLKYDWHSVGTALLILTMAALVSLFITAVQIRKINVVDVMKSE